MHTYTWWLLNRTFSAILRTSPVESEQTDWGGYCITAMACSLHGKYEKLVRNSEQEISSEDGSWKFCVLMEEKVGVGGSNIKIGLKAIG